jgi:hypothetical protein
VDKDKMVIRRYMDAVDMVNLTALIDMVRKNPLLRDSVDDKGRTAAMRLLSNLGSEHIRDFQHFGLLSKKDTLENLCDFAVTLSGIVGFNTFQSLITTMNFSEREEVDAIYSCSLTAARYGNKYFLSLVFGSYANILRDLRLIDETYQGFLDANKTIWQHSSFLDNLLVKLHNSTQTMVDWLSSKEGRIHVNVTLYDKSMMMKLLEQKEWKMATELMEKANPSKTYLENLDWVAVREDDSSDDAFALVKAILVHTDLPDDIFQTLTSSRTRVFQKYIDLFREGDQAREAVAERMNQRQLRRISQGKIAKAVMDNILQFDDLDDVSYLTTAEMYALPRSNLVISRTFQR